MLDSIDKLMNLPIMPLSDVATIKIIDGPGMVKSENARLTGWLYVDIRDRDLGSYVADAKRYVAESFTLPPGYSLGWSGQYEYMLRAEKRLKFVVPITLLIILMLLYFNFKNFTESFMVLGAVPVALVGAIWFVYFLGFNFSVAVGVGLIALAGLAAEFGVVMLVYLDHAYEKHQPTTARQLRDAVIEGAVLRVRPKAMTAAVILAGLLPIMLGEGTGSEVMKRIAAPMLGGMITAPLVSMVIIPVLYVMWRGRQISQRQPI